MNETYEYSDRRYLEPTVDRDERLAFIDTLRNTEAEAMAKTAADTHALGSDLESIEGGLDGAAGVWNNRYVKPNMNSTVAELRSAAQSSALNTALKNLQEQYQKAYNDAYYAALKRGDRKNSGGGGGGDRKEGGLRFYDTDPNADDNATGLRTDLLGVDRDSVISTYIDMWRDFDEENDNWGKFWGNMGSFTNPRDPAYHRKIEDYLREVGGFTDEEINSYRERHGGLNRL